MAAVTSMQTINQLNESYSSVLAQSRVRCLPVIFTEFFLSIATFSRVINMCDAHEKVARDRRCVGYRLSCNNLHPTTKRKHFFTFVT